MGNDETQEFTEQLVTQQLALAVELANVIYWEIDPTSDLCRVNPPLYEFFGTSKDEEESYELTWDYYSQNFIHADYLEYKNERLVGVLESESRETFKFENRIICRDGQIRDVLYQYKNFFDDQAERVNIVGSAIDITEKKEHER